MQNGARVGEQRRADSRLVRRRLARACAGLLLVTGIPLRAAEQHALQHEFRVQRECLKISYDSVFKLGFISLFHPARLLLTVSDGTFRAAPAQAWRPVLIVSLEASPAGKKPSSRVSFHSTFTTVLSTNSFQLMCYEKRVQEKIAVLLLHSEKDYLERAHYVPRQGYLEADVRKTDYLTGTQTGQVVRVELPKGGDVGGSDFLNLPVILGSAVFRPGYFDRLKARKTPIVTRMITETTSYEFATSIRRGRAASPLVGRVKATCVQTTVQLGALQGEVAPFMLWLAAPPDLPAELQTFCKKEGAYAFPVLACLDLSIGSLKIIADGVESLGMPRPPTEKPTEQPTEEPTEEPTEK